MDEILIELINAGKTVLLVDITEQPRYMMERIDIIPDLITKEHLFEDFKKCLIWIKGNMKAN